MVDSIGSKPISIGERGVTRVAAANPVAAVVTPDREVAVAATPAISLASTAKTLAAEAPINSDRIAEIRRAIANNTFPILPATIADRLIALGMQWNSNDKA